MKMLKLLALIAVTFSNIAMQAQEEPEIDVTWSNTMKLGFKGANTKFVGEIDGYLYLLNAAGHEIEMMKLDQDLKLAKGTEFELEGPGGNRNFAGTMIRNNQIHLFSREKDDEKYLLYVETIDKKTLKPAGKPRKLLEAIGSSGLLNLYTGSHFRYYTSADSSNTLISLVGGDSDKSYQFWVVDDAFNVLWSKSDVVGDDDHFDVLGYDITNSGNIFMLVNRSKSGGIFSSAEYAYSVYGFYNKGKERKVYRIGRQNYAFLSPRITELENGTVGIAGFYSDIENESNVGSFFITINEESKKKATVEYTTFDAEFLAYGNSDGHRKRIKRRHRKGKSVGLDPIDTEDVIRRDDGGIVVIGEEYSSTSMEGMSGSSSSYDFGDIYLVNYDPSGSIRWQVKVPKIQHTGGGLLTSMSYTLATVEDNIYLLYNDNPENVNYEGPDNPKTAVIDAAMLMVRIDGNGTVTRSIADDMDNNLYFLPTASREYGGNKVFLMSQKMTKYKFGKLLFEGDS